MVWKAGVDQYRGETIDTATEFDLDHQLDFWFGEERAKEVKHAANLGIDLDEYDRRKAQAWTLWSEDRPSSEDAQELWKQGKLTQERMDKLDFQSVCRKYYIDNGRAPDMNWETAWWTRREQQKLQHHKEWKMTQPTPKQTQKLERTIWGVEWKQQELF